MCRRKKIKCDGRMPKCSHCINYKTECVFTQVEKKRNPPKGYARTLLDMVWTFGTDAACRAKYIEALENRLGRMETLLKMSGLLPEDDGGKTDLGTLEKKLAEKTSPNGDGSRRDSLKLSNGTDSHHSTPQNQDMHSSPRTSVASPGSERDKEAQKEAEVEVLSDMMCSLVTNNCGETRYIGISCSNLSSSDRLTTDRIVVWLLDLLAQGYPVGQRKDRRLFFPGHDLILIRGRQQMDILEARDIQRSFHEASLQTPTAKG
jgi:Fungal Zn(2)-Cys(6) binuclear cluster domain